MYTSRRQKPLAETLTGLERVQMLNSPQPLHCCCCCCVRATCLSLASRAASLTSGPAPSTSRARRWLSRSTAPRRSSPQPEQMPWLLLLPEQTLRSLLNSVADIGRSARVEVLRQTQQVPLQHRNRHLADKRDVLDARHLEQLLLVHVLEVRDVDHHGTRLDVLGRKAVVLGGDAGDDDLGLSKDVLDFVGALHHLSAAHDVDAVEVNAVHIRAVVGEHGSERAAHDLRAVDDNDVLAVHAVAHRKLLVIHLQVLEDLDDSKGSARQKALLGSLFAGRRLDSARERAAHGVNVADVAVEVGAVRVAQSLYILLHRDSVAQIVIHAATVEAGRSAEARIVDHDSMDRRVVIRSHQSVLKLLLRHLAQLEFDAIRLTGLSSPFRVLLCCDIAVRQESNKQRHNTVLFQVSNGGPDFLAERSRDVISLNLLSGSELSHF
mmetsp:Transcript_48633/g.114832  ORF Transcript_48633/g.114832 Transcript_48633/m.114832 type:complete len:436 (-) Transcript_48633:22-1329(-)